MDINMPETFGSGWAIWERGRFDGIAVAIEIIERLLCDDVTTEPQRDILIKLYNALLEAQQHWA